jgi:hypothetical protein
MSGPALQVVQAYDLEAHQGADSESWIETIDDAAFSSTAEASQEEVPAAVRPAAADIAAAHPAVTAFAMPAPAELAIGQEVETGKYVFRRGPIFIDAVTMLDHTRRPSTRLTTARPFSWRIAYYCKGAVPEETLGVALAVNRLADLEPVFQWYSQFIRPDETPDLYGKAPFRVKPSRRGTIELAFGYAPFRQGNYILSIGLLPNAPGTWEFYEYRHFFYPFYVSDVSLGVGAPIFFEPTAIKFADAGMTAEGDEAADD